MKTYTITLTASIEAESEEKALNIFVKENIDYWNTGENIEVEEENEKKYKCSKCKMVGDYLDFDSENTEAFEEEKECLCRDCVEEKEKRS